jgi:CelD/BcsL family acetyltransferase involved in cellulose biosynthesis
VIEVAQLASGEDGAWDDFLHSQAGGLFYHSSWYRDLIAEELGGEPEYLIAREGGEIRGALPMIWGSDVGADGRVLNSLPFNGSHGSPIAATPGVERALIRAWNERSHDPGTLAATMVGNPFTKRVAAAPVHEFSGERGNFSLGLPQRGSRDEVLAQVTSEARSNVRKAERRGVTVERWSDARAVEHARRIHRDRMSELGLPPKSDSFLAAIPDRLRPEKDFDAWVARREGRVVGAMLTLRFNRVADYYLSGSYPDEKTHNPHAALILTALVHEAGLGTRIWNWGGEAPGSEGVNRFKRKWGATLCRYVWFTHVNDRSVLEASPAELSERFPGFYVVPHSALATQAMTRSLS